MQTPKLKRANGNWVDGDRFWDREVELDLMLDYIRSGRISSCHPNVGWERRV